MAGESIGGSSHTASRFETKRAGTTVCASGVDAGASARSSHASGRPSGAKLVPSTETFTAAWMSP